VVQFTNIKLVVTVQEDHHVLHMPWCPQNVHFTWGNLDWTST